MYLRRSAILVTGGAGYIGSHTSWQLAQEGYHIIIVDNFVHNQPWDHSWATVIRGDIGDELLLNQLFETYPITAVMHFAAFAEVGRSVIDPAVCYQNNVINSLKLFDAMRRHLVNYLIFSSSCAIYGSPQSIPITEDHPKNPISPYGASKLMIEQILQDYAHAYEMRFVALRYFNAAGALPEEGLGEYHQPETHAIPLFLHAALHKRPCTIFGADHATSDGTCIRDYVHVRDIADAHIKALSYLRAGNTSDSFNLGTGKGFSVQEIVTALETRLGSRLRVNYAPRRVGDPAMLIADSSRAQQILKWKAEHSELEEILESSYMFALLQHARSMKTDSSQTIP